MTISLTGHLPGIATAILLINGYKSSSDILIFDTPEGEITLVNGVSFLDKACFPIHWISNHLNGTITDDMAIKLKKKRLENNDSKMLLTKAQLKHKYPSSIVIEEINFRQVGKKKFRQKAEKKIKKKKKVTGDVIAEALILAYNPLPKDLFFFFEAIDRTSRREG